MVFLLALGYYNLNSLCCYVTMMAPIAHLRSPGMSLPSEHFRVRCNLMWGYEALWDYNCDWVSAIQMQWTWLTHLLKWLPPAVTHPWIPFFGGLLLNWRVCLCLNLGGPLRGVAGPPLTLVADLISALGASKFMLRGYCLWVGDLYCFLGRLSWSIFR